MSMAAVRGADTQPFPATQPMQVASSAPMGLTDWGDRPRRASFTTSMQADLRKLAKSPQYCSALAVVAASVRHSHPMSLRVRVLERVTLLSVYPRLRQFHCEVDLCGLAPADMAGLDLVKVEPVPPVEPADGVLGRQGLGPLSLLLWHMAKHGATEDLLPEIAGPAVYRVSPGLQIAALPPDPEVIDLLQQMRRRPYMLEELAQLPGFTRARACRLLNAVYLQAGLIVSRSLPKLWT